MRAWIPVLLFSAALVPAAAPALGDSDLTFTLVSNSGSGFPTNLAPDPDPPCLPPDCVLFSGTLTDTDVDTDPSYPYMSLISVGVSFVSNPASGLLSIDNTFYDDINIPGALSGDPNWQTDDSGNPPNSYTGPLFGIDIAPGTSVGVYTGTVTISAAGGLDDPNYLGFTVTQNITVDVLSPEPAAAGLLLAGLVVLMAWCGIKLKWPSSEAPLR